MHKFRNRAGNIDVLFFVHIPDGTMLDNVPHLINTGIQRERGHHFVIFQHKGNVHSIGNRIPEIHTPALIITVGTVEMEFEGGSGFFCRGGHHKHTHRQHQRQNYKNDAGKNRLFHNFSPFLLLYTDSIIYLLRHCKEVFEISSCIISLHSGTFYGIISYTAKGGYLYGK